MKTCPRCNTEKNLSDFAKNKAQPDGLQSQCRTCKAVLWKTYKRKKRLPYINNDGYYTDYPHVHAKQFSKLFENLVKRSKPGNYNRTPKMIGVTRKQLLQLFEDFCTANYHSWEGRNPFRPSVDRIDSTKGYVMNNIRITWFIDNLCKNNFTEEDVLKYCKLKLGL